MSSVVADSPETLPIMKILEGKDKEIEKLRLQVDVNKELLTNGEKQAEAREAKLQRELEMVI